MYWLRLLLLLASLGIASSQAAMTADLDIDGVPLPTEAVILQSDRPQPDPLQQPFGGVWLGAWGGSLKHIMFVERLSPEGLAQVVYAVGASPVLKIAPQWLRLEGRVTERTLTVQGRGFTATYDLQKSGRVFATYASGQIRSYAILTQTDTATLTATGAVPSWTGGRREMLPTALIENDKPVHLETIIFEPSGPGPHPLAVINHGSTGYGNKPELFTQTWVEPVLAHALTERGWMVAFPQRRGRGRSEGTYDEGFSADKARGYTCDPEHTIAGADRALADIGAVIDTLSKRPNVKASRILIGGQSRGGILSVAFAGQNPERVAGVVNFVGGWIGDGCSSATSVNGALFLRGATFQGQMLWLYGNNDLFYKMAHSRANFAAFEKAGGRGTFMEFDVPGRFGHFVIGHPPLWATPLARYLDALDADKR